MRNKNILNTVDKSNVGDYPNGRIQDERTPVDEFLYGDFHEMKDQLMRRYSIVHNNLPDNTTNGYQFIEALKALPSKNDFLLPISLSSGRLNISLKLNSLEVNEMFFARSSDSFSNSNVSTIRGSLDNTSRNVVVIGDVVQGDTVFVIVNSNNITILKNITSDNLDSLAIDLGFLKAATNNQTIAGSSTNVAVTPASFRSAFLNYVLGTNSGSNLANSSRNGLYPRTHFNIVENLTASTTQTGFVTFGDIDRNSVGTNHPVGGDVESSIIQDRTGDGDIALVRLRNSMPSNNYFVRTHIESLGDIQADNDLHPIVFKVISASSFQIYVEESSGGLQNVRIHLEIVER